MSFNTITHPTTGVRYSIFSSPGRELLKSYLNTYKSGGGMKCKKMMKVIQNIKKDFIKNYDGKKIGERNMFFKNVYKPAENCEKCNKTEKLEDDLWKTIKNKIDALELTSSVNVDDLYNNFINSTSDEIDSASNSSDTLMGKVFAANTERYNEDSTKLFINELKSRKNDIDNIKDLPSLTDFVKHTVGKDSIVSLKQKQNDSYKDCVTEDVITRFDV